MSNNREQVGILKIFHPGLRDTKPLVSLCSLRIGILALPFIMINNTFCYQMLLTVITYEDIVAFQNL